MRVLGHILFFFGLVVVLVLSGVMAFFELRVLFTGENILAENVVISVLVTVFRAIYFLLVFLYSIFALMNLIFRKKPTLAHLLVYVAFFAGALIGFRFYEWFIPVAMMGGLALMFFGGLIRKILPEK